MKNLKRIASVFLALMLCSQSFAAVVSDNDGSAFITKSEFDSLKNNFQAQIDNYNQSIDSKIDGAIASYLSGIKISTTEILPSLYEKYAISGFGTTYPLVWSSRTSKATTSPYNTRLGYTEKFEMPFEMTTWFGYGVTSNSPAKQNDLFTNLYKGSFKIDTTLPEKIDTYVMEDGLITQVCDIKGVINIYYVMARAGMLTTDTTKEIAWVRPESGKYVWYNESYDMGDAYVWLNTFSHGKKILPNGIEMTSEGNTQNHGWYRADRFLTWTRHESDLVPVLQPFATHSVNCIIPDVSTTTGYNSSGNDEAYRVTQSALDSYKQGVAYSDFWHHPESSRTAYHVRAAVSIRQMFTKGYSIPTINPSTFKFKDFQQVEPKNGAIKNGVALCEIPKDGKIIIEFTPTETGEIYLWQANTSTDNWGGKKPGSNLPTSATMGYDINVTKNTTAKKEFEVKKDDGLLWVLYRPLGATNEGELKNFNITLTVEN